MTHSIIFKQLVIDLATMTDFDGPGLSLYPGNTPIT